MPDIQKMDSAVVGGNHGSWRLFVLLGLENQRHEFLHVRHGDVSAVISRDKDFPFEVQDEES